MMPRLFLEHASSYSNSCNSSRLGGSGTGMPLLVLETVERVSLTPFRFRAGARSRHLRPSQQQSVLAPSPETPRCTLPALL
jgi:hypothetical protein